jgi:hypothetical protein
VLGLFLFRAAGDGGRAAGQSDHLPIPPGAG